MYLSEITVSLIIGVDVGGTFTDFYVVDVDQEKSWVFKTPSTPADPSEAIASGLRAILESTGVDPSSVSRVSHGTTVATNALIQRKGAKTALIVTKGFRDLLEIGRQTRPHMYSLHIDAPEPLVPRNRRLEADERVTADGSPYVSIEPGELDRLVAQAMQTGAESIAVCFLFSFLNPTHERQLKAALETAGYSAVSISSEVQPEFREFERMSTTVLNAYLQPLMSGYLGALESDVAAIAPNATLRINQSTGGLMSAAQAGRFPVRTALSGPAAGAVGALHVARSAGRGNVITLDMGGTSADVCLIRGHAYSISYDGTIGGFPIRLPMVDVNAVGAGGGSIAWMDRDGLMKVGPNSAGADPGPACYGLGGTVPTVTDANLLLGRLAPSGLLAGRLPLDLALSRQAFEPIASRIGSTVEHAALGCIDIVVANMVRAIRAVSIERGYDPKGFSLLAFGGGGPLHARAVATSLGIGEVIVPPHPGILCAQGLLVADVSESFVASRRLVVSSESHQAIMDVLCSMLAAAEQWYCDEDTPRQGRRLEASMDMRYVGQNYELSVPMEVDHFRSSSAIDAIDAVHRAFCDAHEKQYGTRNATAAVETMNVRVTAKYSAHKMTTLPTTSVRATRAPEPWGSRRVHFGPDGSVECPVYDRSELVDGAALVGPAIVEQLDTTTVVFPGDRLGVDASLNMLIEIKK